MKKYLTLLTAIASLSFWFVPTGLRAREPQVNVEQVLQTTQSWDSSPYASYPTGQPQVTVLRITIPPNTALHWHRHPIISVAYVVSGHLTLENARFCRPDKRWRKLSKRCIVVSRPMTRSS